MIESVQPCVNGASAVKNYGAAKLMEVCRACGVCEPGDIDGPDSSEENCSKFYDLNKNVIVLCTRIGVLISRLIGKIMQPVIDCKVNGLVL